MPPKSDRPIFKPDITDAKLSKDTWVEQVPLRDLSVDAFFMLDDNLNLMSINDAGQSMFRVSGAVEFGKCIVDVIPDVKKMGLYKKCRHVLKTGESVVVPQELGDRSLVVKLFKLGNSLGVIVSDVTERKRVESERERLLNALDEKTRELEQIVNVTSHDLRSPLVNIQGFTGELGESFKQVHEIFDSKAVPSEVKKRLAPLLDEDIPHALQYILASSSKMNSLLSGILRLSRLGRAAPNIKQLDMNKLIAEVVASFEFRVKESGATVGVEKLPPCYGNETQIYQVFSNLMDNSLKYLDADRPGAIRISGQENEVRVTYCVEDNGIGIVDKDRERIFEIFCRLDPDAGIGEGLGLTIVRKILERNSGKVWVESEPGKGSRFFVSLPSEEGINDKK